MQEQEKPIREMNIPQPVAPSKLTKRLSTWTSSLTKKMRVIVYQLLFLNLRTKRTGLKLAEQMGKAAFDQIIKSAANMIGQPVTEEFIKVVASNAQKLQKVDAAVADATQQVDDLVLNTFNTMSLDIPGVTLEYILVQVAIHSLYPNVNQTNTLASLFNVQGIPHGQTISQTFISNFAKQYLPSYNEDYFTRAFKTNLSAFIDTTKAETYPYPSSYRDQLIPIMENIFPQLKDSSMILTILTYTSPFSIPLLTWLAKKFRRG